VLVSAPCVKTHQNYAIRVENLPEIVVFRSRLMGAEERAVPCEARMDIAHAGARLSRDEFAMTR
jgi:hypothetical protein